MTRPLGPVSVRVSGCSSTVTGTPINIASVVAISIIVVSCDLYLTKGRRGHGVFGPCLAGWYYHAQFSHSSGGGDHKGWPSLLLILIFASLLFYQPLSLTYQLLLDVLVDSLPLLFQHVII